MAIPTTPAAQANTVELTFEQALAANVERSSTGKSRTMEVTIINVTNWRPTKTGLAVKMVVTKELGNFFPLASAITNLPTSFGQPIKAKATLSQNGQYTNMNRLEFNGLSTELALSIDRIPAGAALFASAKDLKLSA